MTPQGRYYCPKCDRWFEAHEVSDGMHKILIVTSASGDLFHVVWPEPEARAMLREQGRG